MVITFIFNSCSNIEYNNSKSDLEKMNLKGDICFIIEQKIDINNDQEIPVYEKTIKFNRYSKISYIKENNKETIFSYDENGILIVKKQTENILSMDNGEFIPVSNYEKYYYNNNSTLPYKINEYSQNESNLNSTTFIERDKYNYKTKAMKIDFKFDFSKNSHYNDTTIFLYKHNNKKNYSEIKEITAKKELLRTFDYNSNGIRILLHEKDLNIFIDSTAMYSFSDMNTPQSYTYTKHDRNIIYTYKHDDKNNLIHTHICDSTQHQQLDFYFKYTYDNQGNWIKQEMYDNLHNLISYITRRIEYYPKDEQGVTDYCWENEECPLEIKFNKEKIKKQKEELYLNEDFILEQFKVKMKEYPDYKIIGNPKITYHSGYTYNINFNATHYMGGYPSGYPMKENITVQIILDLETDTYSFNTLKGTLY